jgi:tRNA (cmo5U34)-methyltransferase
MTQKDEKFKDPLPVVNDFDFGSETARVFDDMLDRSVPFYSEIQRMMGEIAKDFAVPNTRIYDLGCSTGTTLQHLDHVIEDPVTLIGMDSSPEMLARAQAKFKAHPLNHPVELIEANLEEALPIENASVVVLNLTLQFVRPIYRDQLLAQIAQGTRSGGCLILVEKVLSEHSALNRLFIKNYYGFKRRNGYSDMEISQKREALENILVPYHESENRELLARNGFTCVEPFFRWYNFSGLIALRNPAL